MKIQQDVNKPYIHIDEDNCILTIKGASYPEHPQTLYGPILERMLERLPHSKRNKVTINLAMTLMNSVSEKCIYQIVKTLSEVNELTINWYYEYDDEDMETEGNTWKSSLNFAKFNILSVENIDHLDL